MLNSPVIVKTYDLIAWLIPHTQKFPKSQRFVMAKRVEDSALDVYASLVAASKRRGAARVTALAEADVELEKLRAYIRLCVQFDLLHTKQYEYAAKHISEVGNLLGAWLKNPERS